MKETTITTEEFLTAATEFVKISNRINDGWKLIKEEHDLIKSYLKKNAFIELDYNGVVSLLKAEYIIFYNVSYEVPAFSFNVWNSSGVLLSLEEIRQMSFIRINQKDFYSVITQQEHPLFQRPYFVIHPCYTEALLAAFRNKTKNIIVTFLGLITPLVRLNMPLDYGL